MPVAIDPDPAVEEQIRRHTLELRRFHETALWQQTDRMFAILLLLQWLGGIAMALCLSPWTWEGLDPHLHPHVMMAIVAGGLIAAAPVALVLRHPGRTVTRMTISVAQVLHSALLIHLSGGRIETHFHIFGSLAFLSFYRDWRVLVPATLVVAADHLLRGMFWPQSVFGVLSTGPWRWVEHAGWVVFEDVCLVWACLRGARELGVLARRQAELEASNARVEAEVARQTAQLASITEELVGTARKAGMAEIATGVLHNVGNVLNTVNVSASVLGQRLRNSEVGSLAKAADLLKSHREEMAEFLTHHERGRHLPAFMIEVAECLNREQAELLDEVRTVEEGLEHIKQIVGAQQRHAKDRNFLERVSPADVFEQAIAMDSGTPGQAEVEIVRDFAPLSPVALDKHKVLEVLINLLSNAKNAIRSARQTGGRITASLTTADGAAGARVRFTVRDNGTGIAAEHLTRIFAHGFTTREDGHGFGLHSAANAAREMNGSVEAHSDGPGRGASFTLDLPLNGRAAVELLALSKQVSP